MKQFATPAVLCALLSWSCGSPQESAAPQGAPTPGTSASPQPGTVVRGDSSTNLDTTPVSSADYAMYAAIMGGASAMLANLSPADKEALAFANRVDAGGTKVTATNEPLLAQARALRQKDIELARLQGVEERYVMVKAKIEAVIGPDATPPSADAAVGRENLRYLDEHRATIERLQGILRNPLARPPQPLPID